ncbi:hypothetical protein GGI13_003541 [Coemansia sp. RSA 455]|nr:hypothetical protein GGH13_005839 [Coemansia sp. S155-1]KAJ2251987.1 hypothetical protein GGI13_003541 [Coemansia sp. RSA 455]
MSGTAQTGDQVSTAPALSTLPTNLQSPLGSHQRLKDNVMDMEAMNWLAIAGSNLKLGGATFLQIVNTLEQGVHTDYVRWCERFQLDPSWDTLQCYIVKECHGGNSQFGISYDLHNLKPDRPVKEFNERFMQLVHALEIDNSTIAKGFYHAKMPPALHKVVRLMEKDKSLKQMMHIVEDEVRAHLSSGKSSAMDVDTVGFGRFITTNKQNHDKGITIMGTSKAAEQAVAVPKWSPRSGFDAMIGCVVAKSGLSDAVVHQRADSGICLLCGDKAHKMSACPLDKGKAQ